jgi:TonB family protein
MQVMPGSFRLGVSVLGALIASVPAPGAPLQPLKPWVLDYDETQCLALHEFGSARNPITLAIRPAPNGETYELLVMRQFSGPLYAEEVKGTVDFGNGPIKAWVLHYGKKTDIYQFRISAAEFAQARSASVVRIYTEGSPVAKFALQSMPELISGLDKCTADLQRYWNMTREQQSKLSVPAKGDVRTIFSSEDYPAEALSRREQGTGQFLLLINEGGRVAGCQVLKATGVPVLDAMGCDVIMKRAKFTPARDHEGKPIRDSYVTPLITWRLAG